MIHGAGDPSPPSKRLLRALISTSLPRAASRRLGALCMSYRFVSRDDTCCIAQSRCVLARAPAGNRPCDPVLLPTLAPISAFNADAPRRADARSRIICHVSPASWQRTRAPSVIHLHASAAGRVGVRQCARSRPPIVCGTAARKSQPRAQVLARILVHQCLYPRQKHARAHVRVPCG